MRGSGSPVGCQEPPLYAAAPVKKTSCAPVTGPGRMRLVATAGDGQADPHNRELPTAPRLANAWTVCRLGPVRWKVVQGLRPWATSKARGAEEGWILRTPQSQTACDVAAPQVRSEGLYWGASRLAFRATLRRRVHPLRRWSNRGVRTRSPLPARSKKAPFRESRDGGARGGCTAALRALPLRGDGFAVVSTRCAGGRTRWGSHQIPSLRQIRKRPPFGGLCFSYLAERGGFEPPKRGLDAYTLSRRAPSTTRTPLRTCS